MNFQTNDGQKVSLTSKKFTRLRHRQQTHR